MLNHILITKLIIMINHDLESTNIIFPSLSFFLLLLLFK